MPNHLHERILNRILNITLLFQDAHSCPLHLGMILFIDFYKFLPVLVAL